MKLYSSLLFIFVLSLCFSCTEKRESVSRPLSSATTQTVNAPQPTPQKSNTAIVISPHANLREADNVRAAVLEVVPQDSSVEVIKQQGAWFLVQTETVRGWMHGNTLKLQSFDISPPMAKTSPKPQPKFTPEQEINNSGATAKCRDGSLSYSAHRRGTCSHHGGVAVWY